uniref:Uncharacterized protein n=1 Tax=Romanomermis culicivorax TaxID=13658 RepID=A0A915JQC7_ROMCU
MFPLRQKALRLTDIGYRYRIEFAPGEFGRSESESAENSAKTQGVGADVGDERSSSDSDDEEEKKKKFPAISIDMKGYGY